MPLKIHLVPWAWLAAASAVWSLLLGVFILQHTSKDRGQKVLVHYGASYVARELHSILGD